MLDLKTQFPRPSSLKSIKIGFWFRFCIFSFLLAGRFIPASAQLREHEFQSVPDYVKKSAPLVWLHSEDPFLPSDLLTHIQHTTPAINQVRIPGFDRKLNLDNLAGLNNLGEPDEVFLTSNDSPTSSPFPSWLYGQGPDSSGRIHDAVPCIVILVEKGLRELDAFFFYFYSYDQGGNITQVLEPLDSLFKDEPAVMQGMHFGNHIGDWEHNMIRFNDGKPIGMYYSQHSDGQAFVWDDSKLSKENGRPIVYSALGSHANYASPGNHVHDAALVDYCDAGSRWDPMLSAYFYSLEPINFTLTPLSNPESTRIDQPTSFFYYTGKWGDERYPDDDPRQRTVPYFHLRQFESGPTGPRSKQLVRKGLHPDFRHRKSWMEWGVSVFMIWYPCCLRGWRVWISGAVVLGGVVAAGLGLRYGIRYAVRCYMRQGYRKLDTDIPLQDVEGRTRDD
ncbi:hypothetical protein D9757_006429 [Collybiopsis confluens]|uniref:Vacuolar protein sorting-associated protein 62 n=1 Tax=Collybiopsis confluens TaxID=2823264 RepID=A0A8H5M8I7_9AGAR|nr:hypothetical protein D9757_006429 [Collybiopsis confluens]